eukprot:c43935_g1_i1 orf=245-1480(-)
MTSSAAMGEKEGLPARRSSWRWVIVIGLLAFFIGTDRLKLSIVANNPEFDPKYGTVLPLEGSEIWRDRYQRLQQAEIIHTIAFGGPESVAFDPLGRGPYTGVADGRVMMWNDHDRVWTEFAYTSSNWSRICIPANPTAPNLKLEHLCGRPLGLRFNKDTGDLYIADAYFGLMVVGPGGGLARSLASEAEGVPFKFTNDLDLGPDGFIYFTDTSSKYTRRQFVLTAFEWDTSGRLLRYDTKSKQTTVLLRGLVGPNGVSVSKNGSFLVMTEGTSARLVRYWLNGPKSGTLDLFALSTGHPDNIRLNEQGDFWVAMHCRRNLAMKLLSPNPWIRRILARLPIPLPYIYSLMLSGGPHAMVARYSADGELMEVLEDSEGKVVRLVSEAEERDGRLWVGSAIVPQIAVLNLPQTK